MKFANCFIDDHGNIWKTKTLIEKSKDLKVVPYEIDAGALVDENIMWKLTNVRDYLVHYKRVQRSDLDVPIILRSDGYIMDGWHRIIKAITCGITTLPSKQFDITPEPDFKEET